MVTSSDKIILERDAGRTINHVNNVRMDTEPLDKYKGSSIFTAHDEQTDEQTMQLYF
jgi:hypothetical protein